MSDEIDNTANTDDGEGVAKTEHRTEDTKEAKDKDKEAKSRSVSFNRDVHIKRYGKPRESRGASLEPQQPVTRKEPFTHLSEQELIEEANKVLAQAGSITCTADHPADKFYSLPHRKKLKTDRSERRNSDENTETKKPSLGRSTSDVSGKKGKERTSLSTLFRRAKEQKKQAAVEPIVVTKKPTVTVKRSKSDVSDLKSSKNPQSKPFRKRTGSETEEFLKSLRNNKAQLSPIIESSPREDYFNKTPPLEIYQKQQAKKSSSQSKDQVKENSKKPVAKSDVANKVNPIEKPPRFKTPETQSFKPPAPPPPPGPPPRAKRGKSKEKSPPTASNPQVAVTKKRLVVDEVDSVKAKENAGSKVKESIRKIKDNVYGETMRHSSQQPPDKPPLTRGQTVDHMVKILKDDQMTPVSKSHIISANGTNVNQPFSYTKLSVSPDPKLFMRNPSPDRVSSPVNRMKDKGVVYAQVIRENSGTSLSNKQTIHKTYTPPKERYISDEDEGYDERHKKSSHGMYEDIYKSPENENFSSLEGPTIMDSPIKPKFREFRLTTFNDIEEPTYANGLTPKNDHFRDFIDPKSTLHRGEADGMDTKRKPTEDLDFNELSHRRQLLESRINRKYIHSKVEEPISKYLAVNDPIYEANKRMAATEKYVNETAKYMRHTLERDGYTESNITEDKYFDEKTKQYDSDNKPFEKGTKNNFTRREYIDRISSEPRHIPKIDFPPEPEYEPPSLELVGGRKPITNPDEYKEKKYKVKNLTSSHDILLSGGKYKTKDEGFGKRKGQYASNPEIASERADDIYANLPHDPKIYYNSLRKVKNTDKYENDLKTRQHLSRNSPDYYRENISPRRYEYDSRLVDSGIENDFRKESSGELYRNRSPRYGSDDDIRLTSRFLVSERRHTEDSYPCEFINIDFMPKQNRRSVQSPRTYDDKISTKPPKAKRLSGLEKVKQLFSRDSSKKSKKEKELTPPKARTRVLKSPEHLGTDDPEYRRYTDPEPSDMESKKPYDSDRRYKSSREDISSYRPLDSVQPTLRRDKRQEKPIDSPRDERYYKSSDRESDNERKYKGYNSNGRYERTVQEDRRYQGHKEARRYEGESDQNSRLSAADDVRRTRSSRPLDSPALAQRYRDRRRLATPSPEPSPPRHARGGWFKSLDRLAKKKTTKEDKVEKESVPSDDSTRRPYTKSKSPLSPAKNLRFFGDTDQESDTRSVTKKPYKHTTLRKTISNSSTGLDEVDHTELSNKSYSLNNLHRVERAESPRNRYYKRNLQNISEIQSNSETESQLDKRATLKPPKNPYDRSSRSQSSQKTLKGSKTDVRRQDDRRSPSELRSSRPEVNRELKARRRTPAATSGESSTEGESSQHSQRSVVFLHATTVGDIPNPERLMRNRSRDDVSSVNSSNLIVKQTHKSFSMFAPWTPRHYGEPRDLHYDQRPRRSKPSFRKATSTRTLTEEPPTLVKNKSASQTTLNKKPNNRLTASSTTLNRRDRAREVESMPRKQYEKRDGRKTSSEILTSERRVASPQDKKTGWFKLSSKNKKPEINTRVR